MDSRSGNLEGNDYERKARYRVMAQSPARFELKTPTGTCPRTTPQLDRNLH